jgi:hypothetical protein
MGRYAGIGPNGPTAKYKRPYGNGRFFRGKSRTQERIDTKLGRIPGAMMGGEYKRYRDDDLHTFDQYMCNDQYEDLLPWDSCGQDEYIPMRKRKPRVIWNLPKRIVNTVAAKLCGDDVFPNHKIEDDPDTETFIQLLIKTSNLKHGVMGAAKKMLGAGSSFLRYFVVGPVIRIELYDSKYCYPTFDEEGHLETIEIRYVYEDDEDRDERGNPREKWYKLVLTTDSDVLFDNPLFVAGGAVPDFQEVSSVQHGLGFVQGQWFRTDLDKHRPDGPSILDGNLEFFDSLNYSLSQADQAVAYAQEPQLAINGLDIDDIDELIKSSTKSWNLGREGKAEFVEADLAGVEKGIELRDKFKQHVTDVCRVVMLDPEKIVGSAQSAKAMEVLHGPLVELVGELRQMVGPQIEELVTKLTVTILSLEEQGLNEVISMPKGWQPKSLTLVTDWPQIFPMTMEDLQLKAQVATSVATAGIISKESITRWIARDFGIEDIDGELAKIAAQPPAPSPFGAF